jgi:hypothetical protein
VPPASGTNWSLTTVRYGLTNGTVVDLPVGSTNLTIPAVPAGALQLGTSGAFRPSENNQLPCLAPVHILPYGKFMFFFGGQWRDANGNVI